MKKLLLLCITAFVLSTMAAAQSSEKMTELINTEKTTYGQAAYLSAVFTGAISETADYSEAVKALAEKNILSPDTNADEAITISELSYICMLTADSDGGLFYKMFPGPRYAFRELKAKGIIPTVTDPSATVSGRDAIALFNGCLPEAE